MKRLSDSLDSFVALITKRFKELDVTIAREHPDVDVTHDLAASHFGLGVRMLVELGWSPADVVALAESIGSRVAGDMPERN